jgi:hypothetical protein
VYTANNAKAKLALARTGHALLDLRLGGDVDQFRETRFLSGMLLGWCQSANALIESRKWLRVDQRLTVGVVSK